MIRTIQIMRGAIHTAIFLAALGAFFLLGTLLGGCPPPRPLTGAQCATSETRKSCGLCSSDPACGWCASDVPAQVGCFDRARTTGCDGTVLRLAEACEAYPDDQVYRED